MYILFKSAILSYIIYWSCLVNYSYEMNRRIVTISWERLKVLYEDPKYVHVYNFSSRRRSRSDPVYYIEYCGGYPIHLDNNWSINLMGYEFLSNEYRPTFVQVYLKQCEFLKLIKLNILYKRNVSVPFVPYKYDTSCRFDPGIYCGVNVTLPSTLIPFEFMPFEKGRFMVNHTYKGKAVAIGTMDMEMKVLPLRKVKN